MKEKIRETIIFRPDDSVERLTVRQLYVLKEIQKQLGERTGHVDYGAISEATGMTWNGVSYAVETLVKKRILERKNGELTILKKIVL